MNNLYGLSLFEEKNIINRKIYKGKGRPKKIDYISAIEAQKIINKDRNDFLDMRASILKTI